MFTHDSRGLEMSMTWGFLRYSQVKDVGEIVPGAGALNASRNRAIDIGILMIGEYIWLL